MYVTHSVNLETPNVTELCWILCIFKLWPSADHNGHLNPVQKGPAVSICIFSPLFHCHNSLMYNWSTFWKTALLSSSGDGKWAMHLLWWTP